MPRPRRIRSLALNALAVGSLVLATFVAGLSIASAYTQRQWMAFVHRTAEDFFTYEGTALFYRGVAFEPGHIRLYRFSDTGSRGTESGWFFNERAVGLVFRGPRKPGLVWSLSNHVLLEYTEVGARSWLVVATFAVLPAWRVGTFIQHRRRHSNGHCLACGYDLRATPDRCPECGAVPAGPRAG